MKLTKQFDDPNGLVSKLVFEDPDGAIAETVAYRYEDRGVICFSVQSGCRVGCLFCGTGKKFIRNLRPEEMYLQIKEGLKVIGNREKIQCMSMSMGEPNMKDIVDHWKIGKLNYKNLDVDWIKFREEVKAFLDKNEMSYYLKKSLTEL